MRYLVDGYNYAWRARLQGGDPEAVRRRIAERLGPLARGGHRLTLVWDSANAPPGVPRRTQSGPVEHLFAAPPGSADDEILALVRDADDPRELCVVTDDLGIARPARNLGVAVLAVREVEERLGLSPKGPARGGSPGAGNASDEKPPPPTGRELDEWERLFREGPGEEEG
jgi:hypothetical protein